MHVISSLYFLPDGSNPLIVITYHKFSFNITGKSYIFFTLIFLGPKGLLQLKLVAIKIIKENCIPYVETVEKYKKEKNVLYTKVKSR